MHIPSLPILWYENEAGERFLPDMHGGPDQAPEGFIYQHSRFPLQLTHSVLRMVLQSEVDACKHEHLKPDLVIIDSMEGRECLLCHGYQSKMKGDPWPEKWQANGSRPVFGSSCSANNELVTQMVRSGRYDARTAVLVAAIACERCMNILGWDLGCSWGYRPDSEEARKANTRCELCKDMNPNTKPVPNAGQLVPADPVTTVPASGIPDFKAGCNVLRADILTIDKEITQLRNHPRLAQIKPEDWGEVLANLTIAHRHLEDARMRLGKAIQHSESRESIFDVQVNREKLAKLMYTRYCEAVGGKAFNGDPLPGWDEFSTDPAKEKQANAWREAATAAMPVQQ